jgi:hypothetical protein
MLGGSLVITAWHALGLRMEGLPSAMEGSSEYIDKRQGVVLQLGGWALG